MTKKLTFDDVLIEPQFSTIKSRGEVDVKVEIPGIGKFLPIISANMDTVTGTEMARELANLGTIGCLHRFSSIEDNISQYLNVCNHEESDGDLYKVQLPCAVSFGLGDKEVKRATELYKNGARLLILDVAHGAQQQVVEQYKLVKEKCPDSFIIVGNFASPDSVLDFINQLKDTPDGIKIGIGPGSACTTRIKTGVGYPQFSAIQDIARIFAYTRPAPLIIADGGLKTPGDIAKALGAGANMVMIGSMLAGTDESPPVVNYHIPRDYVKATALREFGVKYRGSASKESYEVQGKDATHITSEGESFTVPYKGAVRNIIHDIEGGLRSAFSYVGARNLKEFQQKVKFIEVSQAGFIEGTPHGKRS